MVEEESAVRFVAVSVVMFAWLAESCVATLRLVVVALVLVLLVEESDWSVDDPRPMKFVN